MSKDPVEEEGTERKLPKSGEVLSAIKPSISGAEDVGNDERQFVRKSEERAVQAEMQYAHLRGVQDHYRQKARWSIFLMTAVGGMLLFQSGLLVFVGLAWMDFQKYEWLLPALLVQNLGQVIGLAVFAVKYLFSDISDQGGD